MSLENVTTMILAGGMGTRLRSRVSDRPKPLAMVANRPFITYLLDSLVPHHPQRVILCTGHMSEMIEETLGTEYQGMPLFYSQEQEALGTGGALRLALAHQQTDLTLVLNGDSYCRYSIPDFMAFHAQHGGPISLLLTHVDDTSRYGFVQVDENGTVLEFKEKQSAAGPGYINAGIYLINRQILADLPTGVQISIERDVFPRYIGQQLKGYAGGDTFIDIGTPESYDLAQEFFTP